MDLVRLLIQSGSFGALAAVLVAMVLRGDVVPRRTYDDIVRDRDAWRAAHGVSEEGRHEALRQNGQMLEAVHTANHVLQALPTAGREVTHAPVDQAPASPQG